MKQFKALPEIPTQSSNLCNKISWSAVSKAALRSSRTKTETLRASVFRRISFVTLIRAVSVLWWGLKPDWKVSKALLDRRKSESCWYTTFSRTMPGLPVFRHYYWTCSVRVWVFWNDTLAALSDHCNPSWPDIESCNALTLTGASLKALLFSQIKPPIKQLKADFILRNSLKILKQDNNNKSNNNNKFNF